MPHHRSALFTTEIIGAFLPTCIDNIYPFVKCTQLYRSTVLQKLRIHRLSNECVAGISVGFVEPKRDNVYNNSPITSQKIAQSVLPLHRVGYVTWCVCKSYSAIFYF